MSKLLTVFGATGQQGGSLINYILKDAQLSKMFKLRGITRDLTKPAAIKLKDEGVEVIQADLCIPSSLDAAVAGSYAIFAVTNFWEKASAAVEIAQGKAIADAAVAAKPQLLIWSSLPNVTRMTSGQITGAKHFDSKAEVETYIRGLPIKGVFFMAGWYMQNHLSYMRPKLDKSGIYIFSQPWKSTSLVPFIDIEDTGKFIAPALLDPDKYNGASLTCASAFYTPLELVEIWSRVTGKTVVFEQNTDSSINSGLSPEMQHELKKAGGLITEWHYFGPTGDKDLAWTLEQMTEKPTTWEEFVRRNEPWFDVA